MTTHKTGTREQWLKARVELLKTEKELTQTQRRGGAPASGIAMGADQQGISLRHGRRERLAG